MAQVPGSLGTRWPLAQARLGNVAEAEMPALAVRHSAAAVPQQTVGLRPVHGGSLMFAENPCDLEMPPLPLTQPVRQGSLGALQDALTGAQGMSEHSCKSGGPCGCNGACRSATSPDLTNGIEDLLKLINAPVVSDTGEQAFRTPQVIGPAAHGLHYGHPELLTSFFNSSLIQKLIKIFKCAIDCQGKCGQFGDCNCGKCPDCTAVQLGDDGAISIDGGQCEPGGKCGGSQAGTQSPGVCACKLAGGCPAGKKPVGTCWVRGSDKQPCVPWGDCNAAQMNMLGKNFCFAECKCQ